MQHQVLLKNVNFISSIYRSIALNILFPKDKITLESYALSVVWVPMCCFVKFIKREF